MLTLKGDKIYLRALEPSDLDFVFELENDEQFWEMSNTQTPYSRFILKQYLDNAHKDIYEVKQLRLVISTLNDETVGLIDLFNCDFKNRKAGVGIIISHQDNRKKGYGKQALQLLTNYAFKQLNLHQIYCNISEHNENSLKLFKNEGFEVIGLKKDWHLYQGKFVNEYILQKINKDED